MRCLTLAANLKACGTEVAFICRPGDGDLRHAIARHGTPVEWLPPRPLASARVTETLDPDWHADAQESATAIASHFGRVDWVIVDHYALDARWESELRQLAANVMAIDDLANRRHDCDVLLDQNLHPHVNTRYANRVPSYCRRLLGPRYALLRSEFARARATARVRDGAIQRVLIFFGGVDAGNETAKALEALSAPGLPRFEVDVVLGPASPHFEDIRARCSSSGATLHRDPPDIAALAARADLAIGATGAVSWERCCVGLPAVVVSLAPNQESVARGLSDAGLAAYLGRSESVTSSTIAEAVRDLVADAQRLRTMSRACMGTVDGRGTDRVVRALDTKRISLRAASAGDCDAVYAWRNDEGTRRYSHDSVTIPFSVHQDWFTRALRDPSRALLIAEREAEPIGVLRYDCSGDEATVSIYLVPGQHGRGFGSRILCAGHRWLRSNRPEVRMLKAAVLPGNRASIAAFEEAGYRKDRDVYVKELDAP